MGVNHLCPLKGICLVLCAAFLFFFNDTATTEIYTLSSHLGISYAVFCLKKKMFFALACSLLLIAPYPQRNNLVSASPNEHGATSALAARTSDEQRKAEAAKYYREEP